jgi:hypothetical protein
MQEQVYPDALLRAGIERLDQGRDRRDACTNRSFRLQRTNTTEPAHEAIPHAPASPVVLCRTKSGITQRRAPRQPGQAALAAVIGLFHDPNLRILTSSGTATHMPQEKMSNTLI